MAKPVQGFVGCVALMVIGLGVEVAIVAICINVFGMGDGATYCIVFAAWCLAIAYAAYHHDTPAPEVLLERGESIMKNEESENPDFDDLIPGEEYDEEFVDRDEGDPELYDEP